MNLLLSIVNAFLLHELGHVVVARLFGIPVKKIGLNWKGLYVRRGRGRGWPEILTCLAGPLVNFSLALLFWNVNSTFVLCNLIFFLVNILPISNSDGSHASHALEAMRRERREKKIHILEATSHNKKKEVA